MMLKVEGIDPARITCEVYKEGVRRVFLDDYMVARLDDHGPMFDASWAGDFRREAQAVMVAAFDAWKASGGKRLWPEPLPEPVDCVCGAKARVYESVVHCKRADCVYAADNVAEWNAIQDTLKKMKEGT